jgi:hypothetical protein
MYVRSTDTEEEMEEKEEEMGQEEEEEASQTDSVEESEKETVPDVVAAMAEEQPTTLRLYCAFCKWADEEAGPRKREHLFSRINSLSRYIRT